MGKGGIEKKETPWKSWFLGPKSENADVMEQLILEVFRDHVFWRRNFHPEDETIIQEADKREYEIATSKMREELFNLLDQLKAGVPFFSPRYVGHMLSDVLLPAVLGYFATMLYNPNNVTSEVSPVTARLELECTLQLAKMLGFITSKQMELTISNLKRKQADLPIWGHLTSGGTVANFEALWVARNLKYLPLAVRKILKNHQDDLRFDDLELNGIKLKSLNDWELLNLPVETILNLRVKLIETFCSIHNRAVDDVKQAEEIIDGYLQEYSLPFTGWSGIAVDPSIKSGVIIVPATKHYSFVKIADALGLGRKQIRLVELDENYRTDPGSLNSVIEQCAADKEPIIAVVTVFGTTEEGSIDDVGKIAAVRNSWREKGVSFYLHCDAAYGGYAASLMYKGNEEEDSGQVFLSKVVDSILDELRQSSLSSNEVFNKEYKDNIEQRLNKWKGTIHSSIKGIRSTDSVTIDPHKLGYIPYPAGAIVFKSPQVRELIACYAPYLFHQSDAPEYAFIGQYILEGSKPGAAAASCWLAHQVVALNQQGYGALLSRTIENAKVLCYSLKFLEALLNNRYSIEPINDPDLNILCFVINPRSNQSLEIMNHLNNAIYKRLSVQSQPGSRRPVLDYNFFISKTDLLYEEYQQAHGLTSILQAVGVNPEEFKTEGKVSVLRCALMNPWLTEFPSNDEQTDYLQSFLMELRKVIRSQDFEREIRLVKEMVEAKRRIASSERPLNVLIVEDDDKYAEPLHAFLRDELREKVMIYRAHNKTEAIEAIQRLYSESLTLDLTIIDIHLGPNDATGGTEVAYYLSQKFPHSPKIYRTGPYDEGSKVVQESFEKYGMWGLINKDDDPDSYQTRLKILRLLIPDRQVKTDE